MYCMRWWIPLFLLPFPKTSPLFLVLFLFSFALHSQPCMYCALILTGLLATSSNWYGQSSNMAPLMLANTSAPASTSTSNSSTTRTSYGWLDLGLSGGKGFFNPLSRPSRDADTAQYAADAITAKTDSDFYRLSIPWSESQVQIPKHFFVGVGKHQGLGVWIDLGSSKEDFHSSP